MINNCSITHRKINLCLISDTRSFNSYKLNKIKSYFYEGLTAIDSVLHQSKIYSFKKSLKKVKEIELSVTLCSDWKIKKLNNIYRAKNKATDVLSFPVFECFKKNILDNYNDFYINLGDIFISKDTALKQSKIHFISLENELLHLFIHGYLHLYGYDHEISKSEEKIMFDLEDKILNKALLELSK
jgi:probable rRNA maturation factor